MGSKWTDATRHRIRRLAAAVFRAAKEAGVDDDGLAKLLNVRPKTIAAWRAGEQPRGEDHLRQVLQRLRMPPKAQTPNGDASEATATTEWTLGYRAGFADGFDRGRFHHPA